MSGETRYQWYWKSTADPWLPCGQEDLSHFTAYPLEINKIIEDAFEDRQPEVRISDQYKVNFVHYLQMHVHDTFKQRPIIRKEKLQSSDPSMRITITVATAKPDRFLFPAKTFRSFNNDTEFRGCEFIVEWYKWITKGTLKIKNSAIVELAIKGIVTEANLRSQTAIVQAQQMVTMLQLVKNAKELTEIQETCIKLYSSETFLYPLVNETLRDDDRNKFKTLGPFCFLLYNYGGSKKNIQGKLPEKIELYRGESLPTEVIDEYKVTAAQTDVVYRWKQFVSVSKLRRVAERFSMGKAMYIIEMDERAASDQGVYIASLSEHPDEEEVLLRPGIRFKITKFEEEVTGLLRIYARILPSYMSGLS